MIRIKTWHFIPVFAIMVAAAIVIEYIDLKEEPSRASIIKNIEAEVLSDSLTFGMACVLFYHDDSQISQKMECNLEKLAKEENCSMKFFKLNISDTADKSKRKIPYTSIYNNGREIEQIIGLVPVSNLKMIVNRINDMEGKIAGNINN
ncbi:MAG: hypothetical protein E6767_12005 [Dysgonomonas sp.]|nr:hypothetical protein [Dysgonomonas sp.]